MSSPLTDLYTGADAALAGQLPPADGSLQATLRVGTVVVYRLLGYDKLAAAEEPPEGPSTRPRAGRSDIRDEVDEAFRQAGGHVLDRAGAVERGYAVFVDEPPHLDGPGAAVRGAARAQDLVRQAAGDAWEAGSVLELRVGVSTGQVVLLLPADGAPDVVPIYAGGAPGPLASRLALSAGPDDVLLDEATARSLRGGSGVIIEDPIDTAGGLIKVPVWRLDIGTMAAPTQPQRLLADRFSRPVVGRDSELARVRDLFEELMEDGHLRRVAVVGSEGIGRSRLLREIVVQLRSACTELSVAEVSLRSRDDRCEPFEVLGQIVSSLLSLGVSPDAAVERERFDQQLEALSEHEPALAEAFVRTRLARLTGLESVGESEREDPDHAAEAVHVAVAALIRGAAAMGPVMVVVDDLDTARRHHRLAMSRLALGLRECRVLFTFGCTADFAEHDGWSTLDDCDSVIELEPLTAATGRAFIDGVLGARNALNPALADSLTERAGGLPLFLEEALSALFEAGLLKPASNDAEHAWCLADDAIPEGFPSDLPQLLAARLDQIGEREAATLRRASVVGDTFWRELIEDLGDPQAALHLRRLEDHGFVTRTWEEPLDGQVAYCFSHPAIRAIVRAEVPEDEGAALHVRIARWLAIHAGDAFNSWLGAIASHFAAAGEAGHAVSYHLQAGRWARSLGDVGEAREQLMRARALATERETAMEIALELGEALLLSHRFDDAERELAEATTWAEERRDPKALLRCMEARAQVANALFARDSALEFVDRGLPLAESLGAPASRSALLLSRARALHAHGEEEAASTSVEEALALCVELGDVLGEARVSGQMGRMLLHLGRLEEAAAAYRRSTELATSIQHQMLHARARNGLAWVAMMRGDLAEAESTFAEVEDVFERLGLERLALRATVGRAWVATGSEDFTSGANLAAAALARAEELGNATLVALCRATIGHVFGVVETGKHKLKAKQLSAAALRYARVDRRTHMSEALASLEGPPPAPRLYRGLTALVLAEYLAATDSADSEIAEKAKQWLGAIDGGAFADRVNAL